MKSGQLHWRGGGILLTLLLLSRLCLAQTVAGDTSSQHVVQRTPGGVRYLVHTLGPGPRPKPGARLAVRYTGFLPDGHVFDGTPAWKGPLRFQLGRGEVIRGWEEVLALLPAGSKARAWIPAALAYGSQGVRHPDDDSRWVIPPDTDLVFELTVVSVR